MTDPTDVDRAFLEQARRAKARLAERDRPGHQNTSPGPPIDEPPDTEAQQAAHWRQITGQLRPHIERRLP